MLRGVHIHVNVHVHVHCTMLPCACSLEDMHPSEHVQYQTKITYVSRENHANFNACSQEIKFTGAQETFPCSCFTTSRVIRFHLFLTVFFQMSIKSCNFEFFCYSLFLIHDESNIKKKKSRRTQFLRCNIYAMW